jgi:Outer membrane protein beta-barrel domain
MMKTLKLLAIVLFVSAFFTGSAQQIHVGLTTAINATFVLDKGLADDPRYNSTYTYQMAPIGFNFGVDFSRTFGLSLESILSRQGQIYEIIDAAEQIKGQRNIDLSYVHLPLLMRFMSGGNGATRANFNIGPQLSILTQAVESMEYQAGTFTMPTDPNFQLPEGAVNNGDGTYTTPELAPTDLLTKKANQFKSTEFEIAAAFGLDIDLSRHMFLTTQIRANYSLTDMRNGDVIEAIKNGEGSDLFGKRANLLVGLQLGLHYTFGVTRSFKYKQ